MCQAIPRKVLQVAEARAQVLIDGKATWVSTTGLPKLEAGEYVVVYAGAALERIPEVDALELLQFLTAMEAMFDGGEPVVPQERWR